MILENPAALFIHIPKCAGVSVKTSLSASGFTPFRVGFTGPDYRQGLYKTGTADRLRQRMSTPRWDACFKFCVCRNPYDRLVSGWKFCETRGHLRVPFDYFVWHLKTFEGFPVQWHCVIPQKRHVIIDGASVVDAVCRFEQLEDELLHVRTRLHLPPAPLPRMNTSPHGPYRSYYTRELQDLVYERFREDFEFFGYDYDL